VKWTLRGGLLVSSDFELGWLSQIEGDYYQRIAKYAEANRKYLEVIAAYDSTLTHAPDDINALNNKGLALLKRCQVQAAVAGENEEVASGALVDLQAAVEHYIRSLELSPNQAQVRQLWDYLQGIQH
jgi:tetratricopeptide (TPR) repeat protein